MEKKKLFLILLVSFLLLCCGIGIFFQTSLPSDARLINVETDTLPFSQKTMFEQLFSPDSKVTLKLYMEETEIAKLQQDHETYSKQGSKSPIYRMADLEITISNAAGNYTYRIEQVGVRQKGNTSRSDFYDPAAGIYNLIHLKLSFQETFDDPAYYGADALEWSEQARKVRKDRTFATLEKIDLKWNKCDDSTYVKESYAYQMYRSYGVLAPHTNPVSVDWSGVHLGVYTMYEPVDEIFLQKNLPKSQLGGDLYKLGWTRSGATFTDLGSIGIENEDAGEFYSFDLKTNKKTSSHEALKTLITALNSGSLTKERFAQLVDTENFLHYAAVSYFLGNPDDLRNNYNNCYIYFRGDTDQLLVIPYDYDRCFGVTREWNPTGDGVTSDNPFSTVLAATGNPQTNPLFLYSVCAGGYYVREYAAVLASMAQSRWLLPEYFLTYYQKAADRYAAEAAPSKEFSYAQHHSFTFDPEKTSSFSSQGNISFREYVAAKQKTLARYLADVEKYTTGSPAIQPDLYIRANFTNWQLMDAYEMDKDDQGRAVLELYSNNTLCFKVYSRLTDRWYGYEVLNTNESIPCTTDDHTNIILPPGNYWVTFDPATQQITVTK